MTQFTISCAFEVLKLVTSDDIMTLLLKVINIDQNSRIVKPLCSVSKLSTESVSSRCELVATARDFASASGVYIGFDRLS